MLQLFVDRNALCSLESKEENSSKKRMANGKNWHFYLAREKKELKRRKNQK